MDSSGTFLEQCIASYSNVIAAVFTLVVFVIIGLLATLLSRKFAWGVLVLPLVYLGAKTAADFFVMIFIVVTLGLPLLFCL